MTTEPEFSPEEFGLRGFNPNKYAKEVIKHLKVLNEVVKTEGLKDELPHYIWIRVKKSWVLVIF